MFGRVLDDVTVAVHYLVMGYIVFGGFLAWKWRWTIITHAMIICWAVVTLTVPAALCPLTMLENYFRQQGGLPILKDGFIDTYITGVLYPTSAVHVVQVLCAVIVLVSWAGLYFRWHARHNNRTVDNLKLS